MLSITPAPPAAGFRAWIGSPRTRLLLTAFLAGAVTVLGVLPATAGPWTGQKVEKEGVVHISNPAEAMEDPVTVTLTELWRVGGDTDDENEFFGVINRITTDKDGNVYLLDSQLNEVKVFSWYDNEWGYSCRLVDLVQRLL